jgi:hypothetical protein
MRSHWACRCAGSLARYAAKSKAAVTLKLPDALVSSRTFRPGVPDPVRTQWERRRQPPTTSAAFHRANCPEPIDEGDRPGGAGRPGSRASQQDTRRQHRYANPMPRVRLGFARDGDNLPPARCASVLVVNKDGRSDEDGAGAGAVSEVTEVHAL